MRLCLNGNCNGRSIWKDLKEQARNAEFVRGGGKNVKPVVRPGGVPVKGKSARDGHGWKR